MKKVIALLKKEPMLTVSVAAAVLSLFFTPPSAALLKEIDWRTLGTLFMMLTVLEGFKRENIFAPVLRLAGRIGTLSGLGLFLVFSVFFSSMFVTNDVSLIIFVPLTILLFRAADRERFILPLLAMENIAAVRGSLLTPFGSPQNLFIFGRSGVSPWRFMAYMFPIWILSGALLAGFVLFLFRKNLREKTTLGRETFERGEDGGKGKKILLLCLFALVIGVIVSRTPYWYAAVGVVLVAVLIGDRKLLLKTDYVLLLTFLCFFVFSSSVAANPHTAAFLQKVVAGREYLVSILISQVISNVPAAIVLYPFSQHTGALLYGLDSAGLCTLIGSLASVINYRIYVREYPKNGLKFIKVFTLVSLVFFAFVVLPGYFISKSTAL